jgi:hypothetical protein
LSTFTRNVRALHKTTLLAATFLLLTFHTQAQDWSLQLSEELTRAGNHNAIVDMTAIQPSGVSQYNPFANVTGNANVLVKIGCYTVLTAVPWVIQADHVKLEFCTSYSQLQAAANFPPKPLLTVGNNSMSIQGTLIEGGYLNCSNVPGCTPYLGINLNEDSGLRQVNAGNDSNSSSAAIQIQGTTQTNGHYIFENVQVFNFGANDCISIVANGANQHRLRDITCNNPVTTPGKYGVHISAVAYSTTLAAVNEVHAEGVSAAVFFDNRVAGSVRDVDCTNGCSEAVLIGSTSCSDIVLEEIAVSSAPNILEDDCLTVTIPRPTGGLFRVLTFFTQSDEGGSVPQAVWWSGQGWVTK